MNWKGSKREVAVREFSGMPLEYPEKTSYNNTSPEGDLNHGPPSKKPRV